MRGVNKRAQRAREADRTYAVAILDRGAEKGALEQELFLLEGVVVRSAVAVAQERVQLERRIAKSRLQ